ncbi:MULTISPECIES: amidohydrolase [unclassified Saccharothrix]|uniref:amidohydrolase n=1 Tax=unclassified Saccharothrix TaxID=2593673 RepID=UPI00307F559E
MPTPPPADLVLTGGTVLTFDARDREADSLAIANGRVVAVGNATTFIGPDTHVVDLHGRTALPGINDSHLHGAWLGALWPRTLLGPDGADHATPLITDAESRRKAILHAGDIAARLGITSYTEPGLGPGEDNGPTGCFSSAVLDEYATLAAEGLLRARITALRLFGELDGRSSLEAFEKGLTTTPPQADPRWLNVTGVKIFADGIPPMRSAWTHHCYPDGTSGHLLVDGDHAPDREANLRAMITLAHRAGHQIGIHATGDRTIEVVVSALADAIAEFGPSGRHYLIHGDLAPPHVLARLPTLGIGLNTQPAIAVTTATWLEAALGEAVLRTAWPLREAFDRGVQVCLSSDAPVLTPDWRHSIAAAAQWLDLPTTRVLMRRLLRAHTVLPAHQDRAETWKGTLEVGKAADLCVLETNPLDIAPADLPHVDVTMTIVDGRIVHEA